MANKPAAQQEAALNELKAARARKEEEKRAQKKLRKASEAPASRRDDASGNAESSGPASMRHTEHAESSGDDQSARRAPDTPPSVEATDEPAAKQPVPVPRAERSTSEGSREHAENTSQPRRVPYDEPGSLAMLLDRKIESNDIFFELLRCLIKKGLERDPVRLAELAHSFTGQAAAPVD